jgi:uncharacterized RDD family membrane protein YckC
MKNRISLGLRRLLAGVIDLITISLVFGGTLFLYAYIYYLMQGHSGGDNAYSRAYSGIFAVCFCIFLIPMTRVRGTIGLRLVGLKIINRGASWHETKVPIHKSLIRSILILASYFGLGVLNPFIWFFAKNPTTVFDFIADTDVYDLLRKE